MRLPFRHTGNPAFTPTLANEAWEGKLRRGARSASSNHPSPIASGDKETRAKPVSAQAEAGNVRIARGICNEELLRVLENFPAGTHEGELDSLCGGYETVGGRGTPFEHDRVKIFRPGDALSHFDGRLAKPKALTYGPGAR